VTRISKLRTFIAQVFRPMVGQTVAADHIGREALRAALQVASNFKYQSCKHTVLPVIGNQAAGQLQGASKKHTRPVLCLREEQCSQWPWAWLAAEHPCQLCALEPQHLAVKVLRNAPLITQLAGRQHSRQAGSQAGQQSSSWEILEKG
jgi:hypothetical protein